MAHVAIRKGDVVLVHRRHTFTYVDGRTEIADSYTFGVAESSSRSGHVKSVRLATGTLYHVAPLGQQVYHAPCAPTLIDAAKARGDSFDSLAEARDFARPFRTTTTIGA